jgi:hypothetical protein
MKEEAGPLIALILFIILTGVFGFLAWDKQQTLLGDDPNGSKSKETEIRHLQEEIEATKGEILDYQTAADGLREQIRRQRALYSMAADLKDFYTIEYNRRLKLIEIGGKFEESASTLAGTVSELKNKTLQRINSETTESREKMEKELQEKNTAREESITRLRNAKEEFETAVKVYRQQLNYESSAVDDAKSNLANLTERDLQRAEVLNETDGRVILSDVVHGFCIIDLGTSDGVQNGFRFEVFAMQPDGKRLRKAFIEVRRAEPTRSECIVVKRPTQMPTDATSSYVAQEPEEMFSPYQESGRQGASALRLNGKPRPMLLGFNEDHPIVEGDLIQNPFFNKRKALTFYIAGSKELDAGRQKSAIKYSAREIKAVVELYGGHVVDKPDVGVDYVISQKNPKEEGTDQEKAEFQRVLALGLPIVYEWELFRFLDRR